MNNVDRDIQRKLRALRHAEQIGDVYNACRYFGIGRASFYRWRAAFQRQGEAGLVKRKPVPRNPANRTPPEIVEKVLHLRRLTTWDPFGSSGIWRAITTSRSRMPSSASKKKETTRIS